MLLISKMKIKTTMKGIYDIYMIKRFFAWTQIELPFKIKYETQIMETCKL